MKDILQDVVAHTHALGFLPLVKVTSEDGTTSVNSMAEDRSVILSATTHTPVTLTMLKKPSECVCATMSCKISFILFLH